MANAGTRSEDIGVTHKAGKAMKPHSHAAAACPSS